MTQAELIDLVKNHTDKICYSVVTKAKYRDATDNPEWLALCVMNLVEWNVPLLAHRLVVKRVLKELSCFLPLATKTHIRKYFEIYT